MSYRFKAVIYKVGINPVVEVPDRISKQLKAIKGYIPVAGTINGFAFHQNLCPVKNSPYRLYVNGPMMKGGNVIVGDTASFQIQQDDDPPQHKITMPPALRTRLLQEQLLDTFDSMTPSAKKEVYRYLENLKTEESVARNIEKVIQNLHTNGAGTPWRKKN